jgi:F0F1-type ATP synthase assembly protein I
MDKFLVYYCGACLLVAGIVIGVATGLAVDGVLENRPLIVFSIIAPSIIFIIAIFKKWSIKFKEHEDNTNEQI